MFSYSPLSTASTVTSGKANSVIVTTSSRSVAAVIIQSVCGVPGLPSTARSLEEAVTGLSDHSASGSETDHPASMGDRPASTALISTSNCLSARAVPERGCSVSAKLTKAFIVRCARSSSALYATSSRRSIKPKFLTRIFETRLQERTVGMVRRSLKAQVRFPICSRFETSNLSAKLLRLSSV